jgi:group I intron endonuclease
MNKIIGIYKITSPSGKIYIGQSVDIKKRFYRYKRLECSKQSKLYCSLLSYGFNAHTFDIIEECTMEMLNERERYWQDFYNVLSENGLNLMLTKTTDKSGFLSDSHRKKISENHQSKKEGYVNPMQGKKMSKESIEKTASKIRGRKLTDAHKNKISKGNKGKKRTDETKRKIIEKIKGKNDKKVINIENGQIYKSLMYMCEVLNISYYSTSKKLCGARNNNTPFHYL